MGKSSIHIQKASNGAITHNSRENYSKSVVFNDEKNELWNDKKSAYEIYKSEFKKRVEAYTNRTNQKLQKTAVTHLSAVVNLEQHHTLKDLENELGVSLYIKTDETYGLTMAGDYFINKLDYILGLID